MIVSRLQLWKEEKEGGREEERERERERKRERTAI
jgi:hypothetical protein